MHNANIANIVGHYIPLRVYAYAKEIEWKNIGKSPEINSKKQIGTFYERIFYALYDPT